MSSRRRAFTLIEVVATAALLALLMLGATVVLKGPLRQARIQSEIEDILRLDALARAEARRSGQSIELDFHWGTHPTLTYRRKPNHQERLAATATPMPFLQEVAVAQPGLRSRLTIVIDSNGRSPTYGVKLGDNSTASHWIIFAGDTGQPIHDLNDQERHVLFQALQSTKISRNSAD